MASFGLSFVVVRHRLCRPTAKETFLSHCRVVGIELRRRVLFLCSVEAGNARPSMHSRKFESKAALVAYAEQNGLTCLMESFAKWRGRLSPEQYDVVEVRTSRGLKSAMLLPKAVTSQAGSRANSWYGEIGHRHRPCRSCRAGGKFRPATGNRRVGALARE